VQGLGGSALPGGLQGICLRQEYRGGDGKGTLSTTNIFGENTTVWALRLTSKLGFASSEALQNGCQTFYMFMDKPFHKYLPRLSNIYC
jgi:hypothetical protein